MLILVNRKMEITKDFFKFRVEKIKVFCQDGVMQKELLDAKEVEFPNTDHGRRSGHIWMTDRLAEISAEQQDYNVYVSSKIITSSVW